MNPSSSILTPWRPTGKRDSGTTQAPKSPQKVPASLKSVLDNLRSDVPEGSRGSFCEKVSGKPVYLLTLVVLTLYAVHIDDHCEAPARYIRSGNLTFEEAERCIDEIAKVMQFAISSTSGLSHASVPGSRVRECKVEDKNRH